MKDQNIENALKVFMQNPIFSELDFAELQKIAGTTEFEKLANVFSTNVHDLLHQLSPMSKIMEMIINDGSHTMHCSVFQTIIMYCFFLGFKAQNSSFEVSELEKLYSKEN